MKLLKLLAFSAIIAILTGLLSCKPRTASTVASDSNTANGDDSFDPAVAQQIEEMFAQIVNQRSPPGTTGVKRAVFLKPHGCAKATFTITAPDRYKVGLFNLPANTPHDAWVRISSDTIPTTSDFNNNTIGFAVKVLGVPGTKILKGEEQYHTHDFLTQNINVFFVDTAKDFLDFTKTAFDGTIDNYLAQHPRTDKILKDMAKPVGDVLRNTYWSTTPYRFGDNDYSKYKICPCNASKTDCDLGTHDQPLPTKTTDKNYLQERLLSSLKTQDACMLLQVQLRAGDAMPLDQTTVEWSETVSKPQTVAVINLPKQDISVNDSTCENMSFTAWHALPEHRPVGSVNEARGLIYKQLADLRRSRNGIEIKEPE